MKADILFCATGMVKYSISLLLFILLPVQI